MKTTLRRLAVTLMAMTFVTVTSCDVTRQVRQTANLINCQYRILSVQNLTLAGINVQQIKSIGDLGLLDGRKLLTAVASQSFPLTFTLNVEGRNPNPDKAGMNRMDWILLIDNIEMTRGILNQPVIIPPNNGTTVIPMQLSVDLKKVLTGRSADAIINFGLNLAGAGNKPTRITLKVKPTIMIGQTELRMPDYVTISTEYK